MDFSKNNSMSRRHFLTLSSLAAAGWVVGCVTNPVTGKKQFSLYSDKQMIRLDKKYSPQQFSTDYGPVQESQLNAYVSQTGQRIARLTESPQMPYSFRVVNANYVNAYAFPGGSIGLTRGIMLKLRNEGELAALLGHELGHINWRHTASRMSWAQTATLGVVVLSAWVEKQSDYGEVTAQLGMLTSGALLASYSRSNEREADASGLEYSVRAGYSPNGMVGLMEMLHSQSKRKGNAFTVLFSTHPMSSERYSTAVTAAKSHYSKAMGKPLYSERYMDNTSRLRRMKGAIETMQKGEKEMGKKKYTEAEALFKSALRQAPRDYTGLMLMAKCQVVQKKYTEADSYIQDARQVYPQEGQAQYLDGYVKLKRRSYDAAIARFTAYDKLMPGNPNIIFFKGRAYEGKGIRRTAAGHYQKYLQATTKGNNAKYAYDRLVQWGYIKPKTETKK